MNEKWNMIEYFYYKILLFYELIYFLVGEPWVYNNSFHYYVMKVFIQQNSYRYTTLWVKRATIQQFQTEILKQQIQKPLFITVSSIISSVSIQKYFQQTKIHQMIQKCSRADVAGLPTNKYDLI
ncbi:Hypothetical_protein [Hexamita inflata]|uniref:Hypothetical_protein n=1 Tax=Hexamita inflata TaxID=28002 RepID=A0AA86UZX4_9EUKA|nr:Hypothetical protein HINF_LOCUS41478 [Hexamita inflata]